MPYLRKDIHHIAAFQDLANISLRKFVSKSCDAYYSFLRSHIYGRGLTGIEILRITVRDIKIKV